jgi:GT2 family glycosyltransferase
VTTFRKNVLLICVKYDADNETERYLGSIQTLRGLENLQVIVVDNTPNSTLGRTLCACNVRVIQAPGNLGYFGGARYGLSCYLRDNPLPPWVIVSNVDLTIDDDHFIERLMHLNVSPDLGVVAPSIRSNLTGIDQNPFMRTQPSPWRMHAYKWLHRSRFILNAHELTSAAVNRIAAKVFTKRKILDGQPPAEKIYAPHGSFLIFSGMYFERGGDLNYPEFLFGEEVYIAEKVRSLQLKILYQPSMVVMHQEHSSTKLLRSRAVAAYIASSAAYCADAFFPLRTRN